MWDAPPEVLCLADGEVHVWRADLCAPGEADDLDERERERAARFRFERDRQWFTASHSALRRILARYLECAPTAVRIETAEHGKPYVAGPLRFNMSHSHGLALFAVAREEVGIDVERIRTDLDVTALADRFLPAVEALELREIDPDALHRAFFRLWTRREAYLKARGIGLHGISETVRPGWFVSDLDPGPGYVAAIACTRPETRIRAWQYGPAAKR